VPAPVTEDLLKWSEYIGTPTIIVVTVLNKCYIKITFQADSGA
jgi:hypothetical protein